MNGAAIRVLRGLGNPLPRAGGPMRPMLFGDLRQVHNTAKKHHTSLMTSDVKHSTFHKMSLNALKSECRVRGLKVSGRKAELVDRITSFEGKAKPVQKRHINTKHPSKVDSKPKETVSKQLFDITTDVRTTIPRSVFTMKTPSLKEQAPRLGGNTLKSENVTNTKTTDQTVLGDTIFVEEKLTLKDKLFLLGFGTITALWWGSESGEQV